MNRHKWKDNARCQGLDTNLFFDKYEEDETLRRSVESLCFECPVKTICFAIGISNKEWGVWGGVYLENGNISREFNKHRSKQDWAKTWQSLTMEQI